MTGSNPGIRTAAVAKKAAQRDQYVLWPDGADPGQSTGPAPEWISEPYRKFSACMCWDAMLLCAWLAGGIDSQEIDSAVKMRRETLMSIVRSDSYGRVFDHRTVNVSSANDLLNQVAEGSFLGFIDRNGRLVHAMIYVGNGMGAGCKNGCVFSGSSEAWETMDIRRFFGDDRNINGNASRRLVARAVNGQRI
jgi:hypothetical protein